MLLTASLRNFTRFSLMVILLLFLAVSSGATVKKKRFDLNNVNDDTPARVETDEDNLMDSSVSVGSEVDLPKGIDSQKSSEKFNLMETLSETQKSLRERLTVQINTMKAGENSAIWMFLAVCFLYGMLHALGPGHGKSVVVGFFMARRGQWRQGVALGAGITFTHTLSAVLLLFLLFGIFRAAVYPYFEVGRGGIEKASFILLMITGVLLAGIGLVDFFRKPKADSGEKKLPAVARWREIMGVAAITGLVPCPAVALIVLFCLLNSMMTLALMGALTVCVGMTCTNVLFGIAAVAFRKCIDKKTAGSRIAAKIYAIASVLGGVIIFVSGFLLFKAPFMGQI